MLEDPCDDVGLLDERDDAHGGAAITTLERIDLVHFLNQAGPVGLAAGVGRRIVDDTGCRCVIVVFGEPSCAPRTVGIEP